MMSKIINELWAWVAIETDGSEGVVGATMSVLGRSTFAPLVGADR